MAAFIRNLKITIAPYRLQAHQVEFERVMKSERLEPEPHISASQAYAQVSYPRPLVDQLEHNLCNYYPLVLKDHNFPRFIIPATQVLAQGGGDDDIYNGPSITIKTSADAQ
ncbi:hypothetical protein Z517_09353 [Fonsecaea pedrosoi CBS 271.37]|uniref:Uncharacterized protein n=1 Tax=Fonsecaea pedrosoi CBS 271.37 TaxID=1442368 RepID=A0A0D2GX50_9EURO|nr:uncharacterized protein Z517_09353 [Fonsecaea pedrosoi CBS 271.37]KIW76909.1 hypothetical protein Z517_09353 [Fonsecaea pedrosoi CBS 271.37]